MSDLPRSAVACRLYEALITNLHTTDFTEISVNQLCKHADLPRSTFYFYYADKLAVLEELVHLYATQFDELMATLSEPDVDAFYKRCIRDFLGMRIRSRRSWTCTSQVRISAMSTAKSCASARRSCCHRCNFVYRRSLPRNYTRPMRSRPSTGHCGMGNQRQSPSL